LKDHKTIGDTGTEMTSRRHHSKSVGHDQAPGIIPSEQLDSDASGIGRSNTTGKGVSSALKKKFGSIRRRKQEVEA
jgi:hypothetical protein